MIIKDAKKKTDIQDSRGLTLIENLKKKTIGLPKKAKLT